jgi:hypothetical protein
MPAHRKLPFRGEKSTAEANKMPVTDNYQGKHRKEDQVTPLDDRPHGKTTKK